MEKHDLKHKKWNSPYCNEPMNTCDTAVWVHGVLRCAKNQNCTRTRDTHFGFTAGLPVPVFNPKHHGIGSHFITLTCPGIGGGGFIPIHSTIVRPNLLLHVIAVNHRVLCQCC
jgi:hypothetical protein